MKYQLFLNGSYLLRLITPLAVESHISTARCDDVERGYQCASTTTHFWGQYSPWFAVDGEISGNVPTGCEITFAQVLSRHGARYPTTPQSEAYYQTIQQLQQNVTSFTGKYAFLANYSYPLGAEQLTKFGEDEMINSGILFRRRYHTLAKDNVPFVRASSQTRVVESAQHFISGYQRNNPRSSNIPILTISESKGSNNTLSSGLCDRFLEAPYSRIGGYAQLNFAQTFVPMIQERLNSDLPGADLSMRQVIQLMDLCPFSTVASPHGHDISLFCNLFSENEWHAYNYYESLGKYYGHGPGNPLAPTQGVGFVNELLARMTDSPVVDSTSTNRTLDSDPATFPLGRKLYADFSHDNDMTEIFSALGLYNDTVPLSNKTIVEASDKRAAGYSAAWTVPFAARAYFEKMRCEDSQEEYVRILVNGRTVPLVGCDADSQGRCTLHKFVTSQSFARNGGRWNECFV